MCVVPVSAPHVLSRAFVEATRSIIPPTGPSYNGADYKGAWISEIAHRNGRRYSAYDAFLKPGSGRRNLHIETGAQVSRIIHEGGRANSVEVVQGGKTVRYACSRGIILAAGAIGSPLLLLRSGIGPSQDLALPRHPGCGR